MSERAPAYDGDVTILGGGLAGKAAAIHLAKAGLKVVCLEPSEAARQPVGESLDWSAPDLLAALGLPMGDLVESQVATWKRHVTLKMRDGGSEHYVPTPSLAGPPFHIELRTLHVDRVRLDQELLKKVQEQNVRLVRDKVARVESDRRRVKAVHTLGGARISSPWFIDSSGFGASLLARQFGLRAVYFGPAKVALWAYFPVQESVDGTTLYVDSSPTQYLEWIWEIPIRTDMVGVGYVTTGPAIKAQRERGLEVEQIFRQQLEKFPRFQTLLQTETIANINVTSFRCRLYHGVAGPNWLIAGEAASMVDPITSNEVTAALRQGAEAAGLILKYRKQGKVPLVARTCYSARVAQMAKFFNRGIEKMVYERSVRNRIGLGRAGTVYTTPAWSMNVVYARMKPKGIVKTIILSSILGVFRASAAVFYQYCKGRG